MLSSFNFIGIGSEKKKIPSVKSLPLSAKSLSVNDLVEAEDGLGDGETFCLRPTVDFAGDLLLEVKNFVEQCFAFYLYSFILG
jgi:hypothetical protein